MSERQSKGTERGRAFAARSSLHEELWNITLEAIYEVVEMYAPTSATVRGREGSKGNVLVDLDDEEGGNPRTLGIPRAKGTTYEDGDQVLVQRTRGGEYGIISNMASGNSDADEAAVDSPQLKQGAVGAGHIQSGAVGSTEIHDGSVNSNKLDNDLSNKIRDAMTKDAADKAYQEKGNYLKDSDLDGYATKQWVQDNFAKKK